MKAPCQFYGKCSGCTLQHLPYVKQLHDKNRSLLAKFRPLLKDGPDTALQAIVESPSPTGYRISSKLCLHEDDAGRRAIGLYQQGGKTVSDIPGCLVHHPALNKLIQRLFQGGLRVPAPFYNHKKKSFQGGRLKFLTVRYCPETAEAAVVLSHTGVDRGILESWAAKLGLPQLCLYESTLVKSDDDLVLSRKVDHLSGPSTFAFWAAGHRFDLNPLAFFQANHSLAQRFIEYITQDLRGDILLDLYGGFGAYSFVAAQAFEKIYVIETNEHAINAAEASAHQEGLKRISFHRQRVENFFEDFLKQPESKRVNHIICNPPRSGLSLEVRQGLLRSRFDQLQGLVYVSCHQDSLFRDLQALTRSGLFELQSLTPFDMFPQTGHVELVAKLKYCPASASPLKRLPQATTSVPRFFSKQRPGPGKVSRRAEPRR